MEYNRKIYLNGAVKLILLMMMFCGSLALNAQFSGGNGTEDSPYIIMNAQDLNNVRRFLNSHFLVRADIDLDVAPFNEGAGWEPIAPSNSGFTGVFNGGGYTISGLYINRPGTNRVGLFSYLYGRNDPVLVKNLHLKDVNITGGDEVGGIAGYSLEATPGIMLCGVTGRIRGNDKVGGLIGSSLRASFTDNYSDCEISGNNRVGGLGGDLTDTPIENSYAKGRVIANDYVGGLIGYNLRSAVRNSFSLSGIEGDNHVGGLMGYSRDNSTQPREIYHCFAAGRVVGEENVGGFVGSHLRATMLTTCYWDIQGTTAPGSPIAEGRSTTEMTYPYGGEPRTYSDWDFNELWRHDQTGRVNGGYPYLYFQSAPAAPLDSPEVVVDIIEQDGSQVVRLRWEAIENAVSYKIFSSKNISEEDWGEPIYITERTEYIGELDEKMFYYVVASTDEAP